jgi:heterodisulfide reductase subunit C
MKTDKSFAGEVRKRSGQKLGLCYQCLKCSVGCPVARYVDYGPNSIIRMIQYGQKERVLKSRAIWLCVSCMTCGVRCPNEIDMSSVFDTLREMAIEEGYTKEAEANVVALHEEFVKSVKRWGRLHEVTFFMPYMFRSLEILTNMPSGLALIFRGKLPFIPEQIEGIDEIWDLFDKAYKTRGELQEGKTAAPETNPEK